MNRNSNNHAANQIFQHFGGGGRFRDFVQKKLDLTDKDIFFVNGSGAPLDPEHYYNKATCSAMIKIMRDLRQTMKKNNGGMKDVAAVVGVDKSSTTSRMYLNSTTDKSVVAKTGTVSPNITLAGLMTTKAGEFFFMYNFATKGSEADWRNARGKIGALLTKEIRSRGGGTAINYSLRNFSSVDAESDFEAEQVLKMGPKK
jgi:D-alanyl-D-alanine carboxypeptidase